MPLALIGVLIFLFLNLCDCCFHEANYPNLLWMPILGFKDPGRHYNATRRFVLSQKDPSFFQGGDLAIDTQAWYSLV